MRFLVLAILKWQFHARFRHVSWAITMRDNKYEYRATENSQVSLNINFPSYYRRKAKSRTARRKAELPCSRCLSLNLQTNSAHYKQRVTRIADVWRIYVPKYFFPIISSGAAYVGEPQEVYKWDCIPVFGLAHSPKSINFNFSFLSNRTFSCRGIKWLVDLNWKHREIWKIYLQASNPCEQIPNCAYMLQRKLSDGRICENQPPTVYFSQLRNKRFISKQFSIGIRWKEKSPKLNPAQYLCDQTVLHRNNIPSP